MFVLVADGKWIGGGGPVVLYTSLSRARQNESNYYRRQQQPLAWHQRHTRYRGYWYLYEVHVDDTR